MRVLIVCHGDFPPENLLRQCHADSDMTLCTDGVAKHLEDMGIIPDAVIGDMDSLAGAVLTAPVIDAGPHEIQENSDSEKVVLYALDAGAQEIIILGATGGRLDHTLGNIALCARYHKQARIRIMDANCVVEVLQGWNEIQTTPGAIVSLFALTDDCVVTTYGLQWELDEPLAVGTRGISNRAADDRIVIDVTTGLVTLVILKEMD